MGWTDSHLHDFELPSTDAGPPTWIGMPGFEGDDDREIHVEHDERLDFWIHHAGERFFYNYDYGDDWRHEIMVEAIEPAATGTRYPRCLAGERACPPEDVGGPRGYECGLRPHGVYPSFWRAPRPPASPHEPHLPL